MTDRESEAFVWVCGEGHESIHMETTIRSLVVTPRYSRLLADGRPCWSPLRKRVRPHPDEQMTQ